MPEAELHLPRAEHERRDVTFAFVLMAFGGLVLALIASGVLVLVMFPETGRDHRLPQGVPAFPDPQLQVDPRAEWRQFLQRELAHLNSTGWTDRDRHLAHIPIEDAMRQVAHDGIPDWPAK